MHEFALAEAVMATAIKAAEKEGLHKVMLVRLKIGELQQIDKETFAFLVREVSRQQFEAARDASIEIEIVPATFRCRACGHSWRLDDALDGLSAEQREAVHFIPELAHTHMACPECHSPDFDMTQGRGVSVDSIEGE